MTSQSRTSSSAFYRKRLITALVLLIGCSTLKAQDIPYSRLSFHEKVDQAQLSVCSADGSLNNTFTPYIDNKRLNDATTVAVTTDVDRLQRQIEALDLDNNRKISYLRGLQELLLNYKSAFITREITGIQLKSALHAYGRAMALDEAGKDIGPVLKRQKAIIVTLLSENIALKNNIGKDRFIYILLDKQSQENPGKALYLLSKNEDFPAKDSMVRLLAQKDAGTLFNYAASTTPLGEVIRKSEDPLVNLIARIATAHDPKGRKIGPQLLPFLDDLAEGSLEIDQISATLDDPVAYYKLLVQTQIHYAARMQKKDTPLALVQMQTQLHTVGMDAFINKVNGLHERSNSVRYACLKPLSALELYYLIVNSELEIYTSSYINGRDYGLYNLLWKKGGRKFTSDSLLTQVHYDKYKKWIKMTANYNTLDDFLGRMDTTHAQQLMQSFVRGLDLGQGADSLEDAVDVAGSYASIKDPKLSQLVLDEVQRQLQQAKATGNSKKFNIYNILNTLFLSMDPKNKIDLSASLGIGPVYYMPIESLQDSSGRIIIQQFTYGDADGRANYNNFMNAVRSAGWKTTSNEYWSTVSSTSGTPITIYTNKPLDELKALDDQAQVALNSYLERYGLHPTMVLHRGHSYYLNTTIKQLAPSARVVLLGSCGSFQSLSEVLNIAPEAQIISSKQTGVGNLNLTLIMGMLNTLKKGEDLNWVKMWSRFTSQLRSDSRFVDYVPPYENLGAVFYMAYHSLQEKQQAEQDHLEAEQDAALGLSRQQQMF